MRHSLRVVLPAPLLAFIALAVPLRGQSPLRADTSARPMEPVTRVPVGPVTGSRPAYPAMMRSAGWEGTVVAELTVDSVGAVVPGSLRILQRTHELFAASTRAASATWRFEPATRVDSVAGVPRMRAVSAPTRLTISYRLMPDSAAVGRCQAAAPVARVCALQERVIRSWMHE